MAKIGIRDGVISSSAQVSVQVPELRVTGDLIAENYIVSSSVTSLTYQSLSGSTIFGDTPADDTHQFTGSVNVTGSMMISNKLSTSHTLLRLDNESNQASTDMFLDFTVANGATAISRIGSRYVGSNDIDLSFHTFNSSGLGERMRIDKDGNIGIGTASPEAPLHIVGDTMLLADGESDNAIKQGRIGSEHYDVDEEPFYYLYSIVQSDNNQINIGGGTSAGNAATNIQFYTAANNTTATGTKLFELTGNKISGSATSTGSFGLLQTTDRIQTPSDSLKLKGNLTLDGTNIPTLHLDGLVDAVVRIDKAHSYRAAHLRFDTGGSANWFIGTPDSDTYGDGDELYFGTSQDTPIVAIDPQATTALLNLTSNRIIISGSAAGNQNDDGGVVLDLFNSYTPDDARTSIRFWSKDPDENYGARLRFHHSNDWNNGAGTFTLAMRAIDGSGLKEVLAVNGNTYYLTFPHAVRVSGSASSTGSFGNVTVGTAGGGSAKLQSVANDTEVVNVLFEATNLANNRIRLNSSHLQRFNDIEFYSVGTFNHALGIVDADAGTAGVMFLGGDQDGSDGGIYISGSAAVGRNVGIGTDGPLSPLHIKGSSTGAVQAFIHNSNGATNSSTELVFGNWSGAIPTGTGNPGPQARIAAININAGSANSVLAFSTYNSSGVMNEVMRITDTERVGIGTTNPGGVIGEAMLDVSETGTNSDARIVSRTNDVTGSFGAAQGGSRFFSSGPGLGIMTNSNHPIQFATNVTAGSATEDVVIDTNGNVGIGATSPDAPLDIEAGVDPLLILNKTGGNNAAIHFQHAGTAKAYFFVNADQTINLGTATTNPALVIKDNGRVGIGTTSPGSLLTIKDTGDISTATFISGITGDGFRIIDNGSNGVSMEIDNIIVRNTLRTHIFQKDVVKATNGILFISDSGVISGSSNSAGTVTFDNTKSATFNDNDILLFKDAQDNGTINAVRFQINGSKSTSGDFDTYDVDNVDGDLDNLNMGGTAARINGGTVVIDASSTDSPYIDVNASSGSAVVRMGNLAGIVSPRFGALGSEFGLWASGSAYLEGAINAKTGNIGGWGIGETAISSSGDSMIIDALTRRITISDGSNARLYLGEVDGNGSEYPGSPQFGIKIFDGNGVANSNRLVELGEGDNIIAGWNLLPGSLISDNAGGSVALSAESQSLTIWTGSVDHGQPKLVLGKLPLHDGTVNEPYGLAVFSGSQGEVVSGSEANASVLITANKARLAGWELVPGRLRSGTVADINGNNASLALGTNATTATGTPTDGLFFVSASTQPVFYVGANFSYVNDVLTAGGWKIGNGIISSSISPDTDGVIIDSEAKVLTFHGANGKDSFQVGGRTRNNVRLAVGQVATGSYGIKGFDSSGNRVFEISETRNEIAGWSITDSRLTGGNIKIDSGGFIEASSGGFSNVNDIGDTSTGFLVNNDGEVLIKQGGANSNFIRFASGILDIRTGTAIISGSAVKILTPEFFLGAFNDQFISGSSGNIEISSSQFHLNPAAGVLSLSASIEANDGVIGGFTIGPQLLSSSMEYASGDSAKIEIGTDVRAEERPELRISAITGSAEIFQRHYVDTDSWAGGVFNVSEWRTPTGPHATTVSINCSNTGFATFFGGRQVAGGLGNNGIAIAAGEFGVDQDGTTQLYLADSPANAFGYQGQDSSTSGNIPNISHIGVGEQDYSGILLGQKTSAAGQDNFFFVGSSIGDHLMFSGSKFRISGSSVAIETSKFFLGAFEDQFISGSSGNIEISSSMFHLDPKNNKVSISGSITATDGTIGGYNIGTTKLFSDAFGNDTGNGSFVTSSILLDTDAGSLVPIIGLTSRSGSLGAGFSVMAKPGTDEIGCDIKIGRATGNGIVPSGTGGLRVIAVQKADGTDVLQFFSDGASYNTNLTSTSTAAGIYFDRGNAAADVFRFQMGKANGAHLKFNSSENLLYVSSSNFFLGGASTFISGSNDNLEVSSSKFHLKPDGDVIIKGDITAESGDIAGFKLESDTMINKTVSGTSQTTSSLLSGVVAGYENVTKNTSTSRKMTRSIKSAAGAKNTEKWEYRANDELSESSSLHSFRTNINAGEFAPPGQQWAWEHNDPYGDAEGLYESFGISNVSGSLRGLEDDIRDQRGLKLRYSTGIGATLTDKLIIGCIGRKDFTPILAPIKHYGMSSSADFSASFGTLNIGGRVGIGTTTSFANDGHQLHVVRSESMTTNSNQQLAKFSMTKTGGDTDQNTSVEAVNIEAVHNDSNSGFGNLIGGSISATNTSNRTTAGSGDNIIAASINATHTNGNVNTVNGAFHYINVDAGTIDQYVIGSYTQLDIESAVNITGDVIGNKIYMDVDDTNAAEVWGIEVEDAGSANWDGAINTSLSDGYAISGSATSTGSFGHIISSQTVGIGTTSPVAPLHISTTANAITSTSVDVSNLQFKILNPANDTDEAVGMGFALSTNEQNIGAAIIHNRQGSESYGSLHFATKANGDGGAADIPIKMSLSPDGNLGIGTTSPQVGLDIHADTTETVAVFGQADDGNAYIATRVGEVQNRVSGYLFQVGSAANAGYGSATTTATILSTVKNDGGSLQGDLKLATNAGDSLTNAITINSSQKVGIGIDSPDGLLHIHEGSAGTVTAHANGDELVIESDNSEVGMTFLGEDDCNQNILFGDPADHKIGYIIYAHDGDSMTFGTAANNAITINGSQRVGIQTGSPATALVIGGAGSTDGVITFNGTHGGGGEGIQYEDSGGNRRYALNFPGDNIVALSNRAAHGSVQVRTNTSTAGSSGEATIATFNSSSLVLTQGTQDTDILRFHSSEVGHGFTDSPNFSPSKYGSFGKASGTAGGMIVKGLRDSGGNGHSALRLEGYLDENVITTKSTSGYGIVRVEAHQQSGGSPSAVVDNGNLFSIGENNSVRFIIDEDGDIHNDGLDSTQYDSYNDAMLVRAMSTTSSPKAIIQNEFDKYVKYNEKTLIEAGLLGRVSDEDKKKGVRPLINVTGVQKLHNGAIWQQYSEMQQMKQLMYETMVEMIGKEAADKKLQKHGLKLLGEEKN